MKIWPIVLLVGGGAAAGAIYLALRKPAAEPVPEGDGDGEGELPVPEGEGTPPWRPKRPKRPKKPGDLAIPQGTPEPPGPVPPVPKPPAEPPKAGGGEPVAPAVWAGQRPARETVYDPAIMELQLAPEAWSERRTQEIVVFDWKDGDHADFLSWGIGFGICLFYDSAMPFGALNAALAGQSNNPLADPTLAIRIRNTPTPGQIGGQPKHVDWDSFVNPIGWKGQFFAEFKRGANVKIVTPIHEITGTEIGDSLDPCPGDTGFNWPVPAHDHFLVQPGGSKHWKKWNPLPKVGFAVKGTTMVARITYSGMPIFAWSSDEAMTDVAQATMAKVGFEARVKVVAWGSTGPYAQAG